MVCGWCGRDVTCWTFGFYRADFVGCRRVNRDVQVKQFEGNYTILGYQEVPLCRRDAIIGLALTSVGLQLYASILLVVGWGIAGAFVELPMSFGLVLGLVAFVWVLRAWTSHGNELLGGSLLQEAGDKVAIGVVTRSLPGSKSRYEGYVTRYEHRLMTSPK